MMIVWYAGKAVCPQKGMSAPWAPSEDDPKVGQVGEDEDCEDDGGGRRMPESEICRFQGEGIEEHIRLCGGFFCRTERDDLERQIDLLRQRGAQEVISDIGSGLNWKGLLDRILRKEVGRFIIACEDMLTRFGFDMLRRIFEAHGAEF